MADVTPGSELGIRYYAIFPYGGAVYQATTFPTRKQATIILVALIYQSASSEALGRCI